MSGELDGKNMENGKSGAKPTLSTAWRRRAVVALSGGIVALAAAYALALFGFISGRIPSPDRLPLIRHSDFLTYYTAGRLVSGGYGHQLYNLQLQTATQASWLGPEYHLLPFVNPPFLALLLAPLGRLSYEEAFLAWDGLMLVAIVAGIWCLVRAANFRGVSAWLVGGVGLVSVSVLVTLLQSQVTGLSLLGLGLGYWLWRQNKMGLAGVAFALTLFKPHLVLLLPELLLVRREWRTLASFVTTGMVLVVASAIAFGPGVWLDYLRLVGPQAVGTAASHLNGIEPTLGLLEILSAIGLSQQVGLLACIGLGLGSLITIAIRPGLLALDFAFVMAASFVIAPHHNSHDVILLLAAGILVAGVLAHDARGSLPNKVVLGVMVMIGMLLTALPSIVIALAILAWAVNLIYLRFVLSPDKTRAPVRV